jgi:hypothetical protein
VHSVRPYVAALFLLGLSALPVAAAPPSVADAARADHDRIVTYWTPARMAAAQARDFVRTPNGYANSPTRPAGGGSGAVTGASWPNGTGAISKSEGKVYFHMDGSDWQCSGTPATDTRSGYSLVLTAGHCAYDETNGGGSTNGFATNWMFIPDWDEQPASFSTACSASKYGCWTAVALVVDSGFATAGGFNDQATHHDFAFAVVGTGGSAHVQLDATVTPMSLSVGSVSKGTTVFAFGFPAAGKYHGNDLTYCSGQTIEDQYNSNSTWGLACDMTGGSSGGSWLASFNSTTGIGVLGSLNSYGYSGIKNMYGPKFNSNTTAVYNKANQTTTNAIVQVQN